MADGAGPAAAARAPQGIPDSQGAGKTAAGRPGARLEARVQVGVADALVQQVAHGAGELGRDLLWLVGHRKLVQLYLQLVVCRG